MRVVLQRVTRASVAVEGSVVAEINQGIVALVGFSATDDEQSARYILDKLCNLRIFEDEQEKMNLSLQDVNGKLLLIPNFTLYGDARKGRRPGYSAGASPDIARGKFMQMQNLAKELPVAAAFGIFQADMQVELINDGPITLLLDSEKQF